MAYNMDNPLGIIINYEKTWIYKIECKDPSVVHIYVDHTTTKLSPKKSQLKQRLNKTKSGYLHIRLNGGWDNWVLTKVEDFPCSCREKADIRAKQLFCELNNAKQ